MEIGEMSMTGCEENHISDDGQVRHRDIREMCENCFIISWQKMLLKKFSGN